MAAHPIPISELGLETVRAPDQTIVRCIGRINSTTSALFQTTVRSLIPTVVAQAHPPNGSGLHPENTVFRTATLHSCLDKRLHSEQNAKPETRARLRRRVQPRIQRAR